MESSTTIEKMLSGNELFVPNYQRAYSWSTDLEGKKVKQVNQFLIDLEDYINSSTTSKYYFGHFLFKQRSDESYDVIDGQQRLTTIVVFLAALFKCLRERRSLTSKEDLLYKNMISIDDTYHFSTVEYDNLLFKDYVIDQRRKDANGLKTVSQKRIVKAFDFFVNSLKNKEERELLKLLKAVQSAACTTHTVENESEAIQMFIFQNNRGKKPTNLEIIKAQFLYSIHLYGQEKKDILIKEVNERFTEIYESISSIEDWVNEDDVLVYTLRVFFDSLTESNSIETINKKLSSSNCVKFIIDFTRALSFSFEHLKTFFTEYSSSSMVVYSLVKLANFSFAMPFVIKAYKLGVSNGDMEKLCTALESIIIRHRVIGTRADLTSRMNYFYKEFNGSVIDVVNKINWMKTREDWWGYWNNAEFKRVLNSGIDSFIAKFLLWKYENHLIEEEGKAGYAPIRYDSIENAQLEHIAPQNPSGNPVENGYCKYDEEFRNQYLDCLGNYLLLSGSHNGSIGNNPFEKKRETYNQLRQQIEVQQMTEADRRWDKEKINERKKKIVDFILKTF